MQERYFTEQQLDALAKRRDEELGEEAIRRSEREWAELADALRGRLEAGDDPASAPVQALAQHARELLHAAPPPAAIPRCTPRFGACARTRMPSRPRGGSWTAT